MGHIGEQSACTVLLDAPQDIPFFGRLIQREIIYRLLQGSQGARLRAIATLGDQSHRTAKAVAWLRSNYEKPLRVEHLATIAGMSRSTLHHHFRALTAMTPLQFQKRLRLHAARQRMLTGELDAASAAFEVGYESPSQFNREYRRFFGQPPIRDIKALRDSKVVEITAAQAAELLDCSSGLVHNCCQQANALSEDVLSTDNRIGPDKRDSRHLDVGSGIQVLGKR